MTVDPLFAATGTAYGYAADNPANALDPSGLWCITGVAGHNSSGGEICNGKKEVWNNVYHPARAMATAPISLAAMKVNLEGGADCHVNSAEWVVVCSGGPTILGAPATTFGSVINTDYSYDKFMHSHNGRLLAHEVKHTDQWALLGLGFAVYDTEAAIADWLYSEATGCKQGRHNIFEYEAGLKDGGY